MKAGCGSHWMQKKWVARSTGAMRQNKRLTRPQGATDGGSCKVQGRRTISRHSRGYRGALLSASSREGLPTTTLSMRIRQVSFLSARCICAATMLVSVRWLPAGKANYCRQAFCLARRAHSRECSVQCGVARGGGIFLPPASRTAHGLPRKRSGNCDASLINRTIVLLRAPGLRVWSTACR